MDLKELREKMKLLNKEAALFEEKAKKNIDLSDLDNTDKEVEKKEEQ